MRAPVHFNRLTCVCVCARARARAHAADDHKPQNPGEQERIREAGGDVVVVDDLARVTTAEGARAAASGADVSVEMRSEVAKEE